MNITIKDEVIEMRYSFRALMIYENIMQKSFQGNGVTEILTFMYCIILGSKKDLQFTYDEFLDMVDENPALIKEFSEWLTETVQHNNELLMKKEISEEEKKKIKKARKTGKN